MVPGFQGSMSMVTVMERVGTPFGDLDVVQANLADLREAVARPRESVLPNLMRKVEEGSDVQDPYRHIPGRRYVAKMIKTLRQHVKKTDELEDRLSLREGRELHQLLQQRAKERRRYRGRKRINYPGKRMI